MSDKAVFLTKEETEQIKKQAAEFLVSRYFYAAFDQYKKILSAEPHDTDALLGAAMCEIKADSSQKLVRYYTDLYSHDEYEIVLACDKDESHIDEMCEKNAVKGYLEKAEIRKLYNYDVSYKSCLFSRRKQREEIEKLINNNAYLSGLKEMGADVIYQILSGYDERIDEAEKDDLKRSESIRNDYQRFLYKTYGEVRELNQKVLQEKDEDYKALIRSFDSSSDIEEIRKLSLRFEQFGDYKDAKKYVSSCEEKTEELKKAKQDKDLNQVIDNTLLRAKSDLIRGEFSAAYDGFTKAISLAPDNEEARLGILMARTKTRDEDALFEYYEHLYNEGKTEVLEACKEDTQHIEEMSSKYALEGFLTKEAIKEKYSFDRTYTSQLHSRIQEEEAFKQDAGSDPDLIYLRKHGSKRIADRIDSLFRTYSLRVKEAREEDEANIKAISSEYQRFLFKTYAHIRNLNKKADEQKKDHYSKLIRSYELSDDINELEKIAFDLERLDDYKEASRYVVLARKKIEDLQKAEKDNSVSQAIETALVAGKAYLSAGNMDLADQSFSDVLSLDSENAQAYLGILMIETGCRDVDELIDYYKDLFFEEDPEILKAGKEDRKHIDKMVNDCCIDSYLSKEEIEKFYDFDLNYKSYVSSRKNDKQLFEEEVKMNPLLAKASAVKNDQVSYFLEEVRKAYDQRIDEARQDDEKQIASLRHIYEIYLKESDQAVRKLYEERLKKKNSEDETLYRKNVLQFNKDLNEEELNELILRFDPEYKDGEKYVEECQRRIVALRISRQKNKLDLLKEEGTELLECRLYDDAKQKFNEYLDIDPDNEEIRLKQLMADKKVISQDELFDFYGRLYDYEIIETKSLDQDESRHIEEMIEKSYIPGLLEKQEIRRKYHFDLTYPSMVNARTVQKRQIEDELRLDPNLSWLKENGSAPVRQRIDDLLCLYDYRLQEAKEEDENNESSLRRNYRSFLRNTDREVRNLYNELNRQRIRKAKEEKVLSKPEVILPPEEKTVPQEALQQIKEISIAEPKEETVSEEPIRKEEILPEPVREEKTETVKKTETVPVTMPAEKADKKEEERRKAELRQKEKEEKEEQRRLKKLQLEQERQLRREEKQRRKEERALLKKQKEENKAAKPKPAFKLNFAMLTAGLSVLLLLFVVYTYVLVPSNKYNQASELALAGNFDGAIAMFEELGDYKDSAYQVKETTYLKAEDLYNNGDKIAAAQIFYNLRFDDSEDRLAAIKKELIDNAKKGDIILFGAYEQDGDTSNGKELIRWIVLDEDEGSILVLAESGLDARAFEESPEEVYWENSSLRSWLNGRFPDNAFSQEDPSTVLSSTIISTRYPQSEEEEMSVEELVPEEYETRDRLFVLSSAEIQEYLPDEESRICKASEYAIENGVSASADNSCNYWLRSPGADRTQVEYVWGQFGSIASAVQEVEQAVRPAAWLKRD